MTNSTSSIFSGCCTHCRWTAALNQFMTRFWRCSQSGPHWLPCWFTCSFPNLISRSGKILVRIQSLPPPPPPRHTLTHTKEPWQIDCFKSIATASAVGLIASTILPFLANKSFRASFTFRQVLPQSYINITNYSTVKIIDSMSGAVEQWLIFSNDSFNSAYTLQKAEAVFFVLPAMLMFGHILPGHEKVAKLCTNLLWEYYTFHGWIYLDFFSTPNKSHISSIFMCCIACIPSAITFVSTVQIMILL